MKRLLVIGLILVSIESISQTLEVLNLTGRPINRMILTDYSCVSLNEDSISKLNILKKPLQNNKSIEIKIKKGITYNLHCFGNDTIYFRSPINTGILKIIVNNDNIEKFSTASYEWPRVGLRLINRTNYKILIAYYKLHSSKEFYKNSFIQSWNPLAIDEIRPKQVSVEFNQVNNEYVYELLDFYFYGINSEGKGKEFKVLGFDAENSDDVIIQ